MNFVQLKEVLEKEPQYRLKQAKRVLFQDLIDNWSEAKILPQALREELNEKCPIEISAEALGSKDKKTVKALMTLNDGLKIESVLMRHRDGRNTICVSSQVGCPLKCSFCATGRMGFKRNLDFSEIVGQVLFFARYLKGFKQRVGKEDLSSSSSKRASAKLKEENEVLFASAAARVTNVVFMGMGEPFLNYENVILAIKILNDKEGFNLGARHFSISTVGIGEGIKKLAKEKLQINLAISLHASDNNLRSKIMPINKKYPIEEILKEVDDYIQKTGKRVMIEYLMIKGLNDSDEQAKKLAKLMKGKPLVFLNLISYNPTGIFQPSLGQRIKKFKEILKKEDISVTQRYRFGEDITAGCGQLAGNKNLHF